MQGLPDRYLLSTTVPDHWVRLLPVEVTLPFGEVISRPGARGPARCAEPAGRGARRVS